jgi:hypothetical protein
MENLNVSNSIYRLDPVHISIRKEIYSKIR